MARVHHIFANRKNVGDWLSAKGIQSFFGDVPVLEYLCDEPFVEETLEGLSRVRRDDLVVIGGGGLFMDYFTPFWEGFLARAEDLTFGIWGVGAVDLKHKPSVAPRALIDEVVAQSRFCVVRDELTRSLLRRSDVPPPIPCPSIVAVQPTRLRGFGLLHVVNLSTVGTEAYQAMKMVGRQFASRTGRPYKETNNHLRGPQEVRDLALRNTTALYAASDVVLTSRLHGCIIALALGRKVLAVSGDRKVESFMHSAGLDQWVLQQDEVGDLPRFLDRLHLQQTPWGFLRQARQQNAAVARLALAELRQFPEERSAALDVQASARVARD